MKYRTSTPSVNRPTDNEGSELVDDYKKIIQQTRVEIASLKSDKLHDGRGIPKVSGEVVSEGAYASKTISFTLDRL